MQAEFTARVPVILTSNKSWLLTGKSMKMLNDL